MIQLLNKYIYALKHEVEHSRVSYHELHESQTPKQYTLKLWQGVTEISRLYLESLKLKLQKDEHEHFQLGMGTTMGSDNGGANTEDPHPRRPHNEFL